MWPPRSANCVNWDINWKFPFMVRYVGTGTKLVDFSEIDTYQDHRMAMAFAPAGLRFPGLVIRNAGVVSKSFPTFWEQLDKLLI